MVFLKALAGLASTFVKDLVSGKSIGSTLGSIASSVIKGAKDFGSGIIKSVAPIFQSGSPGDFFKKVGEAGLGVAKEVAKGVETGRKILDVVDVAAPLVGGGGGAGVSKALSEGLFISSSAQKKLEELSSKATRVGEILSGI